MNETFDRQSYFRLASPAGLNSTFSREAAAPRLLNSTFDREPAQLGATFRKDDSPIAATSNATYRREDSLPGMNATYRKDDSGGANGSFRKDSGLNTTYQKDDSPSGGNATYRKNGSMSSGNATFDMRPSAAVNSTFDMRPSGRLDIPVLHFDLTTDSIFSSHYHIHRQKSTLNRSWSSVKF
jgi:hypothetical protein